MRFLFPLCIAALSGLAAPAVAQVRWGPDQIPYCQPEATLEECNRDSFALLLSKLRLPPAEQLAAEGLTGIRVFRYDGFGNIWPATSILTRPVNEDRREGVALAVVVHADGEVVSLERPIWENGWQEIDRVIEAILAQPPVEYVPRPVTEPPPPPSLSCLHGAPVVIEVVAEGRVHRWWPQACRADEAVAEAFQAAEIIAAAFPACGHFAIERYGRGLGRVRACLTATGDDPIAAAEVMELLKLSISGDSQVVYGEALQSEDVTLLGLDGRRATGREEVLAALKAGALGSNWLRIVRAVGGRDGVTVIGQLTPIRDPHGEPRPIRIRWVKEADGAWRIVDWSPELEWAQAGTP